MKKKRRPQKKDIILAPFDESLTPRERTEMVIGLSELMMRIATHVICHTLVDYHEQLESERLSVAHAFLQRVVTTHLCNHKLTSEGIVFEYKGQPFLLHEEYKTMTLARTVYEHLAMFYFLFEHPHSAEEADIVWKYWQINSKKNFLDYEAMGHGQQISEEQRSVCDDINRLRDDILSSPKGRLCHAKLDKWTRIGNPTYNGSIEFVAEDGRLDVRRLSYSQAWRYLFNDDDMTLFYRHLSMHCHPVYDGLLQYQDQDGTDQGNDGIPLFFSCCFMAHLCRLFLKQIPGGQEIIRHEFNEHEQRVYHALSRLQGA